MRFFHWALAFSILIEYLSDDDTLMYLHENIGYFVGVLILFRVYLGVFGDGYERFQNSYKFQKETPKEWYGHNKPASFIMVLILVDVLAIVISGMLLLGAKEFEGFFALSLIDISTQTSELIESFHESATDGLLLLIAIHFAGLFVATFIEKERVIQSMITGQKGKVE